MPVPMLSRPMIGDIADIADPGPCRPPACTPAPGSGAPLPRFGAAGRRGRAVTGALAMAFAVAACGGSSDDPVPSPAPVAAPGPAPVPAPGTPDPAPAPVPAPAPAPDPTPVGFSKTGEIVSADGADVGDRFVKDARTVVYDATGGKYYEFVAAPATWDAARAAAIAAGGDLAVLGSAAEMLFVNQAFDGLGAPDGLDGTWVGATQASGATQPGEGWTWVDTLPLPGDSELWNDDFGGLPLDSGPPESGKAQYGAIYDGQSPTDFKLLYDNGTAASILPKYLIEYVNRDAIL